MRIGFWNPYLASLGGGEKYLLTIAEEAVAMRDSEVVFLSGARVDPGSFDRLGISLAAGSFGWVEAGDEAEVSEATRDLDLFVATTHDVPPRSFAARSVDMVQFPSRDRRRLRDRAADLVGARRAPAALASYDLFLCNSEFTRSHIAARLGVDATILPPPVDVPVEEPAGKAREIVTVGRFFRGWHDKRHDVLIAAAEGMPEGVRLHVVGGLDANDPGAAEHLASLRAQAEGLPVTFHVDAPRAELLGLYRRAALYWHAAGYEVDERRHPERMEHFGITTVEAMAHGAVPLSFDGGGQREIVEDGVTGVLWREPDELVAASADLLGDEARRAAMGAAARAAAKAYGRDVFGKRVRAEVLHSRDRSLPM